MTNAEEKLHAFMLMNYKGIHTGLLDLAKAIIKEYPQITKKPLNLYLTKEDDFNIYLKLDEEFDYAFDAKEVEDFKNEYFVSIKE